MTRSEWRAQPSASVAASAIAMAVTARVSRCTEVTVVGPGRPLYMGYTDAGPGRDAEHYGLAISCRYHSV